MFLEQQFVGMKGFLRFIALSAIMPLFSKIHAVSIDSKENILKHVNILNVFKDKVIAIPHGIEIERFNNSQVRNFKKELGLDNNYFLIGFLGRFMSPKGFVYLVDALNLLLQRSDLLKKPAVITFGEGDFIREEVIFVNSKGLQDHIYFLPSVPNVAPVLKGLDVVVMPSLWEACGLLAMETMVSGVPFIGTDCIGLREVLKGTPCKVVPAKNSEALAEAIAQEINCPSGLIAEQFRDEAMRRFDIKDHSRKIDQLVKQLAKRAN
jgi:glycosyltransferase involved in cell wall biosynthesis